MGTVLRNFLSNQQVVKAMTYTGVQHLLASLCDTPWTAERVKQEISKRLTTMFSTEELTPARMEALRFTLWHDGGLSLRLRMDFLLNAKAFPALEVEREIFDHHSIFITSIQMALDNGSIGSIAQVTQEFNEPTGALCDWTSVWQLIDTAESLTPQDTFYDPRSPLSIAARHLLGSLLAPYAAVFTQEYEITPSGKLATITRCHLRPSNATTAAILRPDHYHRLVEWLEYQGEDKLTVMYEAVEEDEPLARQTYGLRQIYQACMEIATFLRDGLEPEVQPLPLRVMTIEERSRDATYRVTLHDPATEITTWREISARELATIGFDAVQFFTTGRGTPGRRE